MILGFVILSLVAVVWGFQEIKIDKIEPGSPAEISGIAPGDRIVSVNGKILIDNTRLGEAIAKGDPIDLVIMRDGREMGITLVPEMLPQETMMIISRAQGGAGGEIASINGATFSGDYVGYGKVLQPESSIKIGFRWTDPVRYSAQLLAGRGKIRHGIYYANFQPRIAKDHGLFKGRYDSFSGFFRDEDKLRSYHDESTARDRSIRSSDPVHRKEVAYQNHGFAEDSREARKGRKISRNHRG